MAESLRLPITIGASGFIALGALTLLYAVLAGEHAVGLFGVPAWILGDVLVSVAVGMMGGLVVAISRLGRSAAWRAAWQAAAASVLVTVMLLVGTVVFLSTIGHQAGFQCDGDAAVWLADDGGCVELPRVWDYLWPPDRWFAPSRCIGGMCG